MTPQQAIALIEKNDLKAVCEAFGRADTQWHEKEWKEFIEAVRREEREKVTNVDFAWDRALKAAIDCVRGGDEQLMEVIKRRIASLIESK